MWMCVSMPDTAGGKASCLLMVVLLISWWLKPFWNFEGPNASRDPAVGEISVCVCVCVWTVFI